MFILVSGLPRSGKSAFADATTSAGYTHVPLDRYIRPITDQSAFLEWVSSPQCIDWALLQDDLGALALGKERVAPSDWGPSWDVGGQQWREKGSGRVRRMKPSPNGYVIPGCYAFELPATNVPRFHVYIKTPRQVVAERAMGQSVPVSQVDRVLDEQLSSNWRSIEAYVANADLVISGVGPHERQVGALLNALHSSGCGISMGCDV